MVKRNSCQDSTHGRRTVHDPVSEINEQSRIYLKEVYEDKMQLKLCALDVFNINDPMSIVLMLLPEVYYIFFI